MRQPERAVALAGLLLRPMSSGSHLAPIGVGAAPDACSRRPCGRPKLQAHDVARRREWPSYLPGPEHDVLGSGWLSQHWLLGKMCWYIATRGNTDLVWWQTGHHEREWPGYLPGPEHDLLGTLGTRARTRRTTSQTRCGLAPHCRTRCCCRPRRTRITRRSETCLCRGGCRILALLAQSCVLRQ